MEVSPQGYLIVRAPNRCPMEDIETFLRRNRAWIVKNLERTKVSRERYLKEEGNLAKLTEDEVELLKLKAWPEFDMLINKWRDLVYPEAMPTSLFDFLPGHRKPSGPEIKRMVITESKANWGSWQSNGTISFNYLLMLAPAEVRDYVVVHELCHGLHPDHSKAFWAEVGRVMPDYKNRKKWLKEKGPYLMSRRP